MKSIAQLLILFLFFSSLHAFEVDYAKRNKALQGDKEQDAIGTMVSAHTAAFSKDSLIKEGIKSQEQSNWQDSVNKIKKYVSENAFNDRDITKPLKLVQQYSDELVNIVKISHATKSSITNLKKQLPLAKKLYDEIETSGKKLVKAKFYINRDKKEKARYMLLSLLDFIQTTVKKVTKEINTQY